MTSSFLNIRKCYQAISVLFRVGLALLCANAAFALASEDEIDTSSQAVGELSAVIQQKTAAYQICINLSMSSLESAAVKREKIASTCKDARNDLVNAFPEEIRQLIATNTDRRVESALYALGQVEAVVIESAEDVNEISEELQALEDLTTSN